MIHGDFRADNLFFEADGSVAAVDFQLIGTGRGAYDLAYFVTQSITSEDAASHERALFDRWIAALEAAGVPDADLADGLGRLPAAPRCSASSTRSWRGGAWTRATPARSAWPPRCSSGSTGPWPSSTSRALL